MTQGPFVMQANFEDAFAFFLPMLRDGKNQEVHEDIKTTLHKGCSILPLSSSVRDEIADIFEVEPDKISHLEDPAVIDLALKGLDDPRTIKALCFHAAIVSEVFRSMDQRN